MTPPSPYGQRLITAAILIPLVVWAVFGLQTRYLALIFAAIVMAAAWEWSALMAWRAAPVRTLYTLTLIPVLYTAQQLAGSGEGLAAVLGAGLAWWLAALVLVVRFQRGAAASRLPGPLGALAGWLLLAPAWTALVYVHGALERGPLLLMFLLGLVWLADSGAYLAGRRWGRRRLAQRVSPGKTWEGVAGGVAAAGVLALAGGVYLVAGVGQLVSFVLVCVAVVAACVVGDLAESLFKRQADLKDSGQLLPGHGGVLDRIDSLTAAAPVFAVGVRWLGI